MCFTQYIGPVAGPCYVNIFVLANILELFLLRLVQKCYDVDYVSVKKLISTIKSYSVLICVLTAWSVLNWHIDVVWACVSPLKQIDNGSMPLSSSNINRLLSL